MTHRQQNKPGWHALRTFLIALAIFLLYAFAVQATEINLEKPLNPGRQETFVRVLRQLADPDILSVTDGRIVFSEASKVTLVRIVETVFMALMASTIGTVLAVPVSFLAARNLMENVTAPLASFMTALVALPIGGWIGGKVSAWLISLSAQAGNSTFLGLVALVAAVVLAWAVSHLGSPILRDKWESPGQVIVAAVRLVLTLMLAFFALGVLAHLGLEAGQWLEKQLGPLGFLGNFVFVLSDMIRLTLPAMIALLGALIAASFGSRYGQEAILRLTGLPARLLTAVITTLGTGVLIFGVGSGLNWLYEFDHPQNWTWIPAVAGGVAAGVLALFVAPKRPFRIGFAIYTIARSILNILRSIEPLIMGIVFVVWVSLGPFAGIMALTLHSIAALGKLFSEQVEGISEGPIEAVTATGANRLQVIRYAVIPQIIPPYTAFTLYRWDINVRMSTIIGFVGGGGIGFVLSQNIQQLRYRQASVMMLAIAVVVSTLDYVSSKVRSRII